jgi:hypothetical protein
MNPIMKQRGTHEDLPHWGMRGMDDLTAEALARWQQTLDRWIRQRAHDPERPRRRPWVMPPKNGPSGVRK